MEDYQIVESVSNAFRRSVLSDQKIKEILAKVKKGTATQKDIADYADLLGQHTSDSFSKYIDYKNFKVQEVRDVLQRLINSDYLSINGQAILQLRASDKHKGLDIIIRQPQDNRTPKLMDKLINATEEQFPSMLSEETKTLIRKFYDDFQKTNAELREELGYDEVVIRAYDDVGLHNRKQPCQFCLARQGTFKYSEAERLGVFQRHEGCGCHIEISTPNWTRTQTEWRQGKHNSQWAEGQHTNQWTDR